MSTEIEDFKKECERARRVSGSDACHHHGDCPIRTLHIFFECCMESKDIECQVKKNCDSSKTFIAKIFNLDVGLVSGNHKELLKITMQVAAGKSQKTKNDFRQVLMFLLDKCVLMPESQESGKEVKK